GVRRARARADPAVAGAGRAHGIDPLSAPVAGGRAAVPRVWARPVGAGRARGAGRPGAGGVRAAGAREPLVARTLPLRPDGMVVALDQLWLRAADARALKPARWNPCRKKLRIETIRGVAVPRLHCADGRTQRYPRDRGRRLRAGERAVPARTRPRRARDRC